ncbi:MAG: hypothetical protein LBB67_07115, partial [Oscillospiraceae bacterium]|nr:hypothetical protein [Oscillospiraceae bacterium]
MHFTQQTTKRLLALLLALLMVTGSHAGVGAAQADAGEADELVLTEPTVNPDYIRWADGEDFGGVVPERYLRDTILPAQEKPTWNTQDVFPAKYDPRPGQQDAPSSALTPVKDQGLLYTC